MGNCNSFADDNNPQIKLFLFGRGYRAMLFHLGALRRLNDFGLLPRLAVISSVSGGSLVAGMLAARWDSLDFDTKGVASNFPEQIETELCNLASTNLLRDLPVIRTLVSNFRPVAIDQRYRAFIGDKTLADLQNGPKFIFTATNLQTGAAWRFSRNHISDSHLGELQGLRFQDLSLVTVVAASAGPLRSPVVLQMNSYGNWNGLVRRTNPGFADEVMLGDGSLTDDFGLTALSPEDILLVSDSGAFYQSHAHPGQGRWNSSFSVLDVGDLQLYRRRKCEVLDLIAQGRLRGTYWDIAANIEQFRATDTLNCPSSATAMLAEVTTDFTSIDNSRQQSLIDWGFASCDAAIRASLDEFRSDAPDASPHGTFYRKPPAAA
jgi:NTE family protein